jgi:hypothetical protein
MRTWLAVGICWICFSVPSGALADAPVGRYVVSDATVFDVKSGLTWQRSARQGNCVFSVAVDYCALLDVAGGGWRLPNVKELQTLTDVSLDFPAIDPTAFPNTAVGSYWSSTPLATDASQVWIVYSYNGITQSRSRDSSNYGNVRCVK